jgi:hypothetical protein
MSMNQRQIELIGHSYQVEREIEYPPCRRETGGGEPGTAWPEGPSALLARAPVEAGLSLATGACPTSRATIPGNRRASSC